MRRHAEFGFEKIERGDILIEATAKAKQVLERDSVELDDFSELYGPGRIAAAKRFVEERESRFEAVEEAYEAEAMQLGLILEALVHEHGEKSNWFGPNALTFKTSKFDDYRGVDEVVQFNEEDEPAHLALAVDVVSSKAVVGKLRRISGDISQGRLSTVEFYRDEQTGELRKLETVPRVAVGADRATVKELAELWVDGKADVLAKHVIQFQILEEILLQCKTFSRFALARRQPEAALKYDEISRIVEKVMEQKREALQDSGKRDAVHHAIEAELEDIAA